MQDLDQYSDAIREMAETGEIDGADLDIMQDLEAEGDGWQDMDGFGDGHDFDDGEGFEYDDEPDDDGFGELGRMVRPMSPSEEQGDASEGVMFDPSRGLISIYDSDGWGRRHDLDGSSSHGRSTSSLQALDPVDEADEDLDESNGTSEDRGSEGAGDAMSSEQSSRQQDADE